MKDRVPLYPGRVTLTPVPGQPNKYDMVRADEPTQAGTPLNKATLLSDAVAALYGLGADAVPRDVLAKNLQIAPWNKLASFEVASAGNWVAPDLFGDGRSYEIGVLIIGGGGAGGIRKSQDSNSNNYASGGASGYATYFTMLVTPGQQYSYVVGLGGAAAVLTVANGAKVGGTGGTSSFNGRIVNGGGGGRGSTSYGDGIENGGQCSSFVTTSIDSVNRFGGVPTRTMQTSFHLSVDALSCINPFESKRILGAGGGAARDGGNSYSSPGGKDPVTGLGGGSGKAITGADIGNPGTAAGCGGGGVAASGFTSGTVTSGAGAAGAVYVYARRIPA